MQNIKLDLRLMAVASFVRKNSRLADIGTDHAYIPVYLVKEGVIPFAVASDINEGPLKNAYSNIVHFSLEDKIKTVLSNGLDALEENCADDIIIAGMGGILIADILSRCSWIKNKNIRLILQPMTHSEKVREFLIKNGFVIEEEAVIADTKHRYCVISAHYEGTVNEYSRAYIYYGKLAQNTDKNTFEYLLREKEKLSIRLNALKKVEENLSLCEYLNEVTNELNSIIKENFSAYC